MTNNALDQPPSVRKAREEYRRQLDTVLRFVEEECTFDPGAKRKASNLYQTYGQWCQDNGRLKVAADRFYARLLDTWPDKVQRKTVHGYPFLYGIDTKPDPERMDRWDLKGEG